MRTLTDEHGFLWRYDCGWRIIADNGRLSMGHPYRNTLGGQQILSQPLGLLTFHQETGFLPVSLSTQNTNNQPRKK